MPFYMVRKLRNHQLYSAITMDASIQVRSAPGSVILIVAVGNAKEDLRLSVADALQLIGMIAAAAKAASEET